MILRSFNLSIVFSLFVTFSFSNFVFANNKKSTTNLSSQDSQFPFFTKGFILETAGNVNACLGTECNKGKPSYGGDFSFLFKNNTHFISGLNFHYGTMSPENLDYLYFYNISFQARGLVSFFNRLELFALSELGYTTLKIAGNNEDKNNEEYTLRSTGISFNVGMGFNINVTSNLQVGLLAKFIYPNWTEACYKNEDGVKCMEPQNADVKLDLKLYYLALTLSYIFPY